MIGQAGCCNGKYSATFSLTGCCERKTALSGVALELNRAQVQRALTNEDRTAQSCAAAAIKTVATATAITTIGGCGFRRKNVLIVATGVWATCATAAAETAQATDTPRRVYTV
ncbi:MAG: hypothetical protein KDK04_10805 [Candidatus Competibacteraceae bacterium]|nr:hypothetical protein [Candidatus Competibacteraceae bacterium]